MGLDCINDHCLPSIVTQTAMDNNTCIAIFVAADVIILQLSDHAWQTMAYKLFSGTYIMYVLVITAIFLLGVQSVDTLCFIMWICDGGNNVICPLWNNKQQLGTGEKETNDVYYLFNKLNPTWCCKCWSCTSSSQLLDTSCARSLNCCASVAQFITVQTFGCCEQHFSTAAFNSIKDLPSNALRLSLENSPVLNSTIGLKSHTVKQ